MAEAEANTTPPGWYPDPDPTPRTGIPLERYWNGTQWTVDTRPTVDTSPILEAHGHADSTASPRVIPAAPLATTTATLGILSMMLFPTLALGFIVAIGALITAPRARTQIATSNGTLGGKERIIMGVTASIITLVFSVFAVIGLFFILSL